VCAHGPGFKVGSLNLEKLIFDLNLWVGCEGNGEEFLID
jgi:hypothetical protein